DEVDVPGAGTAEVVPLRHIARIRAEVGRALNRVDVTSGKRRQSRDVEQVDLVRAAGRCRFIDGPFDANRVLCAHAEEEAVRAVEHRERIAAAGGEYRER